MKILIIRFSSIGDIVLTTPVIRTLKTQLDDAEIHYATKIQYKAIFEANPYVDKMIYLERNLNEFIKDLKNERYDYIIDLHNNLRTRIIKLSLRVKSYSFDKLNIQKWLMVNLKINRLPDIHIVERYMNTVKPLGIKMDALGLDYFIPDKDEVPWSWLPASHQNGFIAYAIGAQHETKKLPVARMIELCEKINQPVTLMGGKEDYDNAERIKEVLEKRSGARPSSAVIFNACGLYNLNQSASIIKKARYVFSHDTGLMHIAAAFKREIFSIWGNTIPAFGMYPYRTRYKVLEDANLSCRPCSKIGYEKCPRGHFRCMNDIVFDFYLK